MSSIAIVQWDEIPNRFGFVACDQKYMWRAFSYKPFFFEGEWKFDVASSLLDTGREEMKLSPAQVAMCVSPSTQGVSPSPLGFSQPLDFSQTLQARETSRPYHLTAKHAVNLMSKGGEWLGAARTGLQCKTMNGSDVTWGSNEQIKGLTVANFELIAASIAAAAQNELLSQMKFGSQPAYLVSLGQTNLCPHTVQDLVELFGLRSTVLIEGDDGVKKPLSMKDLDFNRGELCFKRKSS